MENKKRYKAFVAHDNAASKIEEKILPKAPVKPEKPKAFIAKEPAAEKAEIKAPIIEEPVMEEAPKAEAEIEEKAEEIPEEKPVAAFKPAAKAQTKK